MTDPRYQAKWTDAEIRKLIHEIQTRAEGEDSQGRVTVTFGKLFVETDQIFDALSGILKTAKKYGIVAFDGEQLWQGQNDATVITLVEELHDGITIKRRRRSALNRVKSSDNASKGGFGQVRNAPVSGLDGTTRYRWHHPDIVSVDDPPPTPHTHCLSRRFQPPPHTHCAS